MSNNSLLNSPSRISHAKRKMPESFYRPPVQKTQLFSASEILPRSIHHSHTNSLPVEVPPQQMTNLSNAFSASNLYDKSNSIQQQQLVTYYQNETSRGISPLVKSEQQYFHAKTYSLPVTFDPIQQTSSHYSQTYAPPTTRTQNPNGDIPLPPGWTSEKTPNGQIYFINHFLKTTTWEDPRKLYNLPTNQCEISNELRLTISKTIPLPLGWEEARSANGEIYFINHNNKTTCWEDPRINIYMQQEQQKHYAIQQSNQKISYNQGYYQNSSLSSSSVSILSSNSSTNSLNLSNQNLNCLNQDTNYSLSSLNLNNKTPKERVDFLKQTLDDVNQQKNLIGKQLDDLTRLINNLKSKLSPQDLEDVMNRIQPDNNKIATFSSFDKLNQLNENTPNKKSKNTLIHSNSPRIEKSKASESLNGDMDSTILADLSNNHTT